MKQPPKIVIQPAEDVPNNPAHPKGVYMVHKLEPGQALVCPTEHRGCDPVSKSDTPKIAATAYTTARRRGWKVTCHRQADGSVRVERLK